MTLNRTLFHTRRAFDTDLLSYRRGSLELFLYQEIGIEQDAAVAYLSDGKRFTTSNIRDLGSAQDQVSCPR